MINVPTRRMHQAVVLFDARRMQNLREKRQTNSGVIALSVRLGLVVAPTPRQSLPLFVPVVER